MTYLSKLLLACTTALLCTTVLAQEAIIRQNLAQRVPALKAINEVTKTQMPGVYEVRVNGTEIYYTDARANFLIQGELIDTVGKRNLTEERVAKLTAIRFDELPFKDAFTIVRGDGKRKLAVFEDPNCGYCKRFERDLQKIDNITVYLFLYPVLGPDSKEKAKAVWCAADRAKAWEDWMVRERATPPAAAMCDSSAVTRNAAFGRAYKIDGTPTLIFSNGARVPGAIDDKQIEKLLAAAGN